MGKLLDARSIIRLAKKHSDGDFCSRDEGLIAMGGLAYFSASDLSLVKVSDLVTERHGVVFDGYLSGDLHISGKLRYFFIGRATYLRQCLERVIQWRVSNGLKCLDRNLFCGLDPESYFFIKNDGARFDLNFKQRFDGDTLTQPLQLQRHIKTFYLGEGVTLTSLMDSFIANYWNAKSTQGSTQAIKDLMEMTCLTADTLRTKCIRQQDSIQEILVNLYK